MNFYLTLLFIFYVVNAKDIHVNLREGRSNILEQYFKNTNLRTNFDYSNSKDQCERRVNPLDPNYFYFLPVVKAKLKQQEETQSFIGRCFKHISVKMTEFTENNITIKFEADDPIGILCNEMMLIHTPAINQLVSVFTTGEHQVILTNMTEDDFYEIKVNGLKVFGFCQGLLESIKSLTMSILLFLGGLGKDPKHVIPLFRPKVPEYMYYHNTKLVQLYNNITIERREDIVVDIDEKEIHTGDFIGIVRMDGVDNIIMIGTGSRIGHCCVTAWIDGKLYVLESQAGWYWPRKGIQKNEWKQWIEWAHNADFSVILCPLKEEIRKKLDVQKAMDWYNKMEGFPYGFKNFLFSFIDTPDSNLPFVASHEHFEFLFSIAEKIYPPIGAMMLGEGLNLRLGTKNLTIVEASALAAKRGISFEDLLAIPENDDWVYSDGPSRVCSCFVVGFYKAGGLFGDLKIHATEFTPRDLYQLNFFDKNYKRPKICEDTDPDLPYCQIMGKTKIVLQEYSTIAPYSHMNEKCPSKAPEFYRPDRC